jgi:hypothetical protein
LRKRQEAHHRKKMQKRVAGQAIGIKGCLHLAGCIRSPDWLVCRLRASKVVR